MNQQNNTSNENSNSVRKYFTNNRCPYRNCIFNLDGCCLRQKSEQGEVKRTFNRECFLKVFKEKSVEEIKNYFSCDKYEISHDLLPQLGYYMELFVPSPEKIDVYLQNIKNHLLVDVCYDCGDHVQHSTLFLRDLFQYELKKREAEFKKEEKRFKDKVDSKSNR